MRRGFFSKFKDYNYILDKVLEEKRFSEDAKNLLLNMIYKIENSYKDYSQIKGVFQTQSDFIDSLIENISNYCKQLYLVDPKREEVKMLKENNVLALTNEREQKIYAYPTELAILYGLIDIKPKYYYIPKNYYYFKKQLQELLVEGTMLNFSEVIRNFNGWSWNVAEDANINQPANMIYQAIRILIDEDFLREWEQNTSSKIDYIYEMRKELAEYYGNDCSRSFYLSMARLVVATSLKTMKPKIKAEYDKVMFAYDSMKDKTKYIYKVSQEKKKIAADIEEKDKLLKDNKALLTEFKRRNSILPNDKKIFNLSDLVNILQLERQACVKRIRELNTMVQPLSYTQLKNELAEKLQVLSVAIEKKRVRDYSIDFQREVLKCFYENINKVSTKEEIIDIIYKMRYFRKMRVTENEKVEDIPVLADYIRKIVKTLITKGCKEKVFNIFCDDIEYNYQIIDTALDTAIANYEDVDISVKIVGENLEISVYDNEVIDKKVEIEYFLTSKDLNVKQGRRIPMYVM